MFLYQNTDSSGWWESNRFSFNVHLYKLNEFDLYPQCSENLIAGVKNV